MEVTRNVHSYNNKNTSKINKIKIYNNDRERTMISKTKEKEFICNMKSKLSCASRKLKRMYGEELRCIETRYKDIRPR